MSLERETSHVGVMKRFFRRTLGRMRIAPERRRPLAIVASGAVSVALLVVAPGYIASQPRFFERYDQTKAEYRTWNTSVHAKVACQGCHVPPQPLARSVFHARMLGEFYLSFAARSRGPRVLTRPVNDACSKCHIDLRSVSPSGDLRIPHRAHVEVLGIECVRCHRFLVHQKSPEGKHVPRMSACLKCHDGRQAKDACSTCHTEKSAPKSHAATDWTIVHPRMRSTVDCADCHGWTTRWCAECHTRRPKSHTARWRSDHPAKVESHRNCEACHPARFCVRCHGEVPSLNFDPEVRFVE